MLWKCPSCAKLWRSCFREDLCRRKEVQTLWMLPQNNMWWGSMRMYPKIGHVLIFARHHWRYKARPLAVALHFWIVSGEVEIGSPLVKMQPARFPYAYYKKAMVHHLITMSSRYYSEMSFISFIGDLIARTHPVENSFHLSNHWVPQTMRPLIVWFLRLWWFSCWEWCDFPFIGSCIYVETYGNEAVGFGRFPIPNSSFNDWIYHWPWDKVATSIISAHCDERFILGH